MAWCITNKKINQALRGKEQNMVFGFYGYIDGYFEKNIGKMKINKNILKFMKIFY